MKLSFLDRVVRRLKKILDLEPRHRFYKVSSPPLPDRYFTGPHGHELYASAFNPAWFAELAVRAKAIVDVGSYDGGDALRFQHEFPDAQVITVEADPDRAIFVRDALNGTAVKVLECAVSDVPGEIGLFRTAINGVPSSQGSIFRFTESSKRSLDHIVQDEVPTNVTARTLDEILTDLGIPEVSLLHMDIQGAEYNALKGIGNFRPLLIYVEVNSHYIGIKKARDVHRLLTDMNYQLAGDFISDRLYFYEPSVGS